MKQRVALYEFPVFSGVFPLASGYLESWARLNPQVRDAFEFEKYSLSVSRPDIMAQVDAVEADVYTFSCYVWNMGLVKRILRSLHSRRPHARVILGGPQVLNKPHRNLNPEHESLVVCNGEGEPTFASYLAQLVADRPDLTQVKGLSFYRDGELITTPKPARIRDLDETPSPYLEGCFDPQGYVMAVLETNRGCPFKCTYCYWGAATNNQVHKYGQDRVMEEITWLSENKIYYIFLADANFGMLQRDIEIARHIADCKQKNGYPMLVYYSASKNTPERVVEVAKLFDEAGLITAQPISLQTMSADTLENVKRSNIKMSSYTKLQRYLDERKLPSFTEMIWPLPGETLRSFKEGIAQLCRSGADVLNMYPLLLLNNVEMEGQREEFGLVTIEDSDPNSEAEMVVETKDVSFAEYLEGLRYIYHVATLYSARGLRHVGGYLDATGLLAFEDLITSFADFCKQRPNHPYTAYIEGAIAASEQSKFNTVGGLLHLVLHDSGPRFDRLLWDFMQSLSCGQDDQVRFLFELDLLNRPYIYLNTPIVDKRDKLALIEVVAEEEGGCVVEIPPGYYEQARELLGFEDGGQAGHLSIDYRATQLPYMKAKSLEDSYEYCANQFIKIRRILPKWSAV